MVNVAQGQSAGLWTRGRDFEIPHSPKYGIGYGSQAVSKTAGVGSIPAFRAK